MQMATPPLKRSRKRLLIAFVVLGLLVASFFIYKYTYIHIERAKYDKAAAAINKVADDLRAQGIETEFSKGCNKSIAVYGDGSTSCFEEVSITGNKDTARASLGALTSSVRKNGFTLTSSNGVSADDIDIKTGTMVYSLLSSALQCRVKYSTPDETTSLIALSCGRPEKYKLF